MQASSCTPTNRPTMVPPVLLQATKAWVRDPCTRRSGCEQTSSKQTPLQTCTLTHKCKRLSTIMLQMTDMIFSQCKDNCHLVFSVTFSWHFPVRRPGSEQFTSKSSNGTCVGTYVRTALKKTITMHWFHAARRTARKRRACCSMPAPVRKNRMLTL